MNQTMALSSRQLLELSIIPGEETTVIAVVGCGGKTTWIKHLANEFQYQKVLITPTTKIRTMKEKGICICKTLEECVYHIPVTGIQCLGIENSATGKLEALPPPLLKKIYKQYDLVLLEADGSRGLPCKGWGSNEPVIPPFVTHTVGIVTMNAIGKYAAEENVLRLPAFLAVTQLKKGNIITMEALLDMINAPDGMFKNSRGKRYLFVNQSEDKKTTELAEQWLRMVHKKYSQRYAALAYGSAQTNRWRELKI